MSDSIDVSGMMPRREAMQVVGRATVALAMAGVIQGSGQSVHGMPRKPRKYGRLATMPLAKFVDPLPIPSIAVPVGLLPYGVPVYDIDMRQVRQKLHRDLPSSIVWGYNGSYPGPTFDVRRGKPIAVRWRNSLPSRHLFPIDPTLHGAEPPTPAVRTVTHVHGMKVLPESDGYPEAWFTNGFAQTGPSFLTKVYNYPNDQPPTTLWYHDHAMGITRLNVNAGLAGFYLIRDKSDVDLNLPTGPYEIPLLIQDRIIAADGALVYPIQTPGDSQIPPIWIPEFFGDTVLVNGKVFPYLEVEPRKYRFRILNGSNDRFYHLTLNRSTRSGLNIAGPGPVFHLIGTDGGYLPTPVSLTDFLMAPAERFDVIIDFTGTSGEYFVLNNDAPAPYPDGTDVVPAHVMLFKVTKPLTGRDKSTIPASLPAAAFPLLQEESAVKVRDLVLSEQESTEDNPVIGLINTHWDQPVTETPKAGTVEIWRIINTTGDVHPIHIHLSEFRILDRQPFDVNQYPPNLVFTGPATPPPPEESNAAKDTFKAFPGTVLRVIGKFDLPTGSHVISGRSYRYVVHCHMLDHEDNEMMRPFDVIG